jgi:hypothetical protein
MNKKRTEKNRSRILVVVLITLAAVAGLWPTAMTLLFQTALSNARTAGLRIAWQGVSASYLSAHASLIEVWLPGPPIQLSVGSGRVTLPGPALKLEIADLSLSIDPLSLFTLAPSVQATARLYGGELSAEARNVLSEKIEANFELQGVSLEKHPQIRSLGIGGGTVNVKASELLFSVPSQTIVKGDASIQVTSLSLPSRRELDLILKGERLTVQSLSTNLSLSQGSLSIKPIEFSTSLGSASGRATIGLPSGDRKVRIDADSTFSLSQSGLTSLGQWLPLVSNGVLTAESQRFGVTTATTNCSDKTLELPFGCLRVVFSPKGTV